VLADKHPATKTWLRSSSSTHVHRQGDDSRAWGRRRRVLLRRAAGRRRTRPSGSVRCRSVALFRGDRARSRCTGQAAELPPPDAVCGHKPSTPTTAHMTIHRVGDHAVVDPSGSGGPGRAASPGRDASIRDPSVSKPYRDILHDGPGGQRPRSITSQRSPRTSLRRATRTGGLIWMPSRCLSSLSLPHVPRDDYTSRARPVRAARCISTTSPDDLASGSCRSPARPGEEAGVRRYELMQTDPNWSGNSVPRVFHGDTGAGLGIAPDRVNRNGPRPDATR